jgi:hypothetical protein
MSFRRSDLQEAFFVPGTHAFRVFGYGTSDALEAVLGPGYFGAAGALLQPGDLVYVRASAGAHPEAATSNRRAWLPGRPLRSARSSARSKTSS